MNMKWMLVLPVLGAMAIGLAVAQESAPTSADRVMALKQNLAQSQQKLKQYTWTETTTISYKGEEKSKKVNSCVYDAQGKVAKTEVSATAPDEKGGLRGKIADHKKEGMVEYMQSAVALLHSYIPPDPAKIQACKDAGNMAMTVVEPGKKARVDFKDYEKPGDVLAIELDLTTNQILGVTVSSYLADAKDVIKLDVAMAALADGASHPAVIKVDAPEKNVGVVVTNTDYKKKG